MINLLALQASEFSEQYFDNILSCIENIEVEKLEDIIKTQMSSKKRLLETSYLNEKYHFTYNNLANITRNLLEIEIGIRDFYTDYGAISFEGLDSGKIGRIQKYIIYMNVHDIEYQI